MTDDWIFIDTNILVYAFDTSAHVKNKIAAETIASLWHSGMGMLSTQVLQEFYVTVTQKIPHPMGHEKASGIIQDMLNWKVIVNDGRTIIDAINIQQRYKLSFWDSLIIEAASSGGAGFLFSEDLSDQQTIKDVKIVNPFN